MKNILLLLAFIFSAKSVALSRFKINEDILVWKAAALNSGELKNLEGSTSNIQAQLNATLASVGLNTSAIATKADDTAVVHKTGTETISGAKTFTGKLSSSSTTFGNQPCPTMTDAQMLAITGMQNGDCVINSTKKGPFFYSSTDSKWKPAGGGAGGSRLNLLVDGSFEDGVTEGTCTGCEAKSEDTDVLLTPSNEKALRLTFTASSGCYVVDKSSSVNFGGMPHTRSIYLKTTIPGMVFNSRVDGIVTQSRPISSRGTYLPYEIPEIGGSVSNGYSICSTGIVSGIVLGDESFVGPNLVVKTAEAVGAWTDPALPVSISTTKGNVAWDSAKCRSIGESWDCEFDYQQTSAGVAGSGVYRITLPPGVEMASSVPLLNGTSPGAGTSYINPKSVLGWGRLSNNSTWGEMIAYANTSTTLSFSVRASDNSSGAWSSSFYPMSTATLGFKIYVTFKGKGLTPSISSYSNLSSDDGLISEEIFTSNNVTPTNFIPANNKSIGIAGANYNGEAYKPLYNILWARPGLSTTAGDPYRISSTKGVSADADWLAGKLITIDSPTNYAYIRYSATNYIVGLFPGVVATKGVDRPTLVSASVSASEAITEDDSQFISSCTNADPSVCTLAISFFTADPKCWANVTLAGAVAAVTADDKNTVTVDRTDASTPFTLFCHGKR